MREQAEQLPLMFPDQPIPWPTGTVTLGRALLEYKRRRREDDQARRATDGGRPNEAAGTAATGEGE